MKRSILAVVGGFLFIAILSFGADAVFRAVAPDALPPQGQPVTSTPVLLVTMAYVAVFAVAGCYLAARWAGRQPMKHALILGALGLAFNIVGFFAMRGLMPTWYVVANLLLVMPYAWLGGWIREREVARSGGLAA